MTRTNTPYSFNQCIKLLRKVGAILNIQKDDLSGKEITDFLQAHIDDMQATSPPESKHALDIEGLKQPHIHFWSGYYHNELVACVALMLLNNTSAEIKSMRVSASARGKGFAKQMLMHVIQQAKLLDITTLKLETGSMDFFKPARQLYAKHGFEYCEPFAQYKHDKNSVFMSKTLSSN